MLPSFPLDCVSYATIEFSRVSGYRVIGYRVIGLSVESAVSGQQNKLCGIDSLARFGIVESVGFFRIGNQSAPIVSERNSEFRNGIALYPLADLARSCSDSIKRGRCCVLQRAVLQADLLHVVCNLPNKVAVFVSLFRLQ